MRVGQPASRFLIPQLVFNCIELINSIVLLNYCIVFTDTKGSLEAFSRQRGVL